MGSAGCSSTSTASTGSSGSSDCRDSSGTASATGSGSLDDGHSLRDRRLLGLGLRRLGDRSLHLDDVGFRLDGFRLWHVDDLDDRVVEHGQGLGTLLRRDPGLADRKLGRLVAVEVGRRGRRRRLRDRPLACGHPLEQQHHAERETHDEDDRLRGPAGDTDDDADHDQETELSREPQEGRRQRPLAHAPTRGAAACVPGSALPGLHRPAGPADVPQLGAELGGGALEDLDRLERAQGRVELGRVPVEGVEGLAHLLAVVALLGDRQVLDPGQGRRAALGLTRRRGLRRRPLGVAHPPSMTTGRRT